MAYPMPPPSPQPKKETILQFVYTTHHEVITIQWHIQPAADKNPEQLDENHFLFPKY
jgi:hypothetical protein